MSQPQYKFIRLPDVMERTGKSKTTIYRDIKNGTFPRQIPNGVGSVAWLESDINKWQEDMMKLRPANDR